MSLKFEEAMNRYSKSEIGTMSYMTLGSPLTGLSGIKRFSRRLKVREENVAEHMWYVSYITSEICKELEMPERITLAALKYAIYHDVPELVLDDVNHDVKQAYPEISKSLQKQEDYIFSKLGQDIYNVYNEEDLTTDNLVARLIVTLADVHSVALYIDSEQALGNLYFDSMKGSVNIRILDCEQALYETLYERGKEIWR